MSDIIHPSPKSSHLVLLLVLGFTCSFTSQEQQLQAEHPNSTSVTVPDHPYHHVPSRGHASQNPGSPKWFVPGYGYQTPPVYTTRSLNPWRSNILSQSPYTWGTLQPLYYSDPLYLQSRSTFFRTPWLLPGSSTNLKRR